MRVSRFNDIIVEMTKQNFNPRRIKIIAGLGNPGTEYADTYHNVGTTYILRSVEKEPAVSFDSEKRQHFSHARHGAWEWVTTHTFMNESGTAIHAALKWFKASPKELLVIHDDADLPVGTVRVDFERGAAGHNGILSVIAALGTNGFWRARIGIRTENTVLPREKAEVFVLKKITPVTRKKIETAFGELDRLLDQGVNT